MIRLNTKIPCVGFLLVAGSALTLGTASYANVHSADISGDGRISLSELLRVIQFFNSAGYHCKAGTEDGFALGPGSETCPPHSTDYEPKNWRVELSELLRLVQLYNTGGYRTDPTTEDGFAPDATLDPHILPVYGDITGSFLTHGEESALGLDPDNPDENSNGIPDGIDLALALTDEIEALPLFMYSESGAPTDHVYLFLAGEAECYCLDPFTMQAIYPHAYEIVNPMLDIRFTLDDAARVFLQYGSFNYYLYSAGGDTQCGKATDDCVLGGQVYRLDIPGLVHALRDAG